MNQRSHSDCARLVGFRPEQFIDFPQVSVLDDDRLAIVKGEAGGGLWHLGSIANRCYRYPGAGPLGKQKAVEELLLSWPCSRMTAPM